MLHVNNDITILMLILVVTQEPIVEHCDVTKMELVWMLNQCIVTTFIFVSMGDVCPGGFC